MYQNNAHNLIYLVILFNRLIKICKISPNHLDKYAHHRNIGGPAKSPNGDPEAKNRSNRGSVEHTTKVYVAIFRRPIFRTRINAMALSACCRRLHSARDHHCLQRHASAFKTLQRQPPRYIDNGRNARPSTSRPLELSPAPK
jgi:hypothetical protein